MPLAGEWGPGGSVLYMFQRVKGRKKKKMPCGGGKKKNTTNPKQNADGSCADSPLSALWRALLYFMWVSSLVLILLSLPSYLSITHSLASSISWLINQPLFQAVISPDTPHLSPKWLCWPFPLWDGCCTAAAERTTRGGGGTNMYCMKSECLKGLLWDFISLLRPRHAFLSSVAYLFG